MIIDVFPIKILPEFVVMQNIEVPVIQYSPTLINFGCVSIKYLGRNQFTTIGGFQRVVLLKDFRELIRMVEFGEDLWNYGKVTDFLRICIASDGSSGFYFDKGTNLEILKGDKYWWPDNQFGKTHCLFPAASE